MAQIELENGSAELPRVRILSSGESTVNNRNAAGINAVNGFALVGAALEVECHGSSVHHFLLLCSVVHIIGQERAEEAPEVQRMTRGNDSRLISTNQKHSQINERENAQISIWYAIRPRSKYCLAMSSVPCSLSASYCDRIRVCQGIRKFKPTLALAAAKSTLSLSKRRGRMLSL